MTAALAAAKQGLDTVLVEKSDYFGGSTARSGGGVWIPGNYALARPARSRPTTRRSPSSTSTRSSATWCPRSAATPISTAAPR